MHSICFSIFLQVNTRIVIEYVKNLASFQPRVLIKDCFHLSQQQMIEAKASIDLAVNPYLSTAWSDKEVSRLKSNVLAYLFVTHSSLERLKEKLNSALIYYFSMHFVWRRFISDLDILSRGIDKVYLSVVKAILHFVQPWQQSEVCQYKKICLRDHQLYVQFCRA